MPCQPARATATHFASATVAQKGVAALYAPEGSRKPICSLLGCCCSLSRIAAASAGDTCWLMLMRQGAKGGTPLRSTSCKQVKGHGNSSSTHGSCVIPGGAAVFSGCAVQLPPKQLCQQQNTRAAGGWQAHNEHTVQA